jgi:hypothetical protein
MSIVKKARSLLLFNESVAIFIFSVNNNAML